MIYELSKDYFVRPLDEEDLNGAYPKWFQNQEVCQYNSHTKFFKTKAYFRNYVNDLNREDNRILREEFEKNLTK